MVANGYARRCRPGGVTELRVGMICPPDHEMFGVVADRLGERGFAVEFIEPGVPLPPERIDTFDLLVNKKVRWESLRALAYAHRTGVPAWNAYVPTTLLLNRLSQLSVLGLAGFAVPELLAEPPDGEYVAKGLFDVHDEPRVGGEGAIYQPLLPTDGVDHKYYAVDDGERVRLAVVRFESKLFGERRHLGRGEVDERVTGPLRRLLRLTGARGVGVDVVYVDRAPVAVDANPATSFRRTGLEGALADSVAAAADGARAR